MPAFSRILSFLVLGCLPVVPGVAQHLSPLTADPGRAAERPARPGPAHRTTALALPFFDDFAREELGARPDPALWLPQGGVYRNNRFALNPITQGVATFDGLRATGQSYGGATSGDTDTLTSQVIDLSGRQSVVLSFWWQAGGVGGLANLPTTSTGAELVLEFNNGLGGGWTQAWNQPGLPTSATDPTPFQEAFVLVDPFYLTPTFQFRFRSFGSQAGTGDVWNVDYVLLDANRQPQPSAQRDVGLNRPLPSALARYAAMPVWQFNAASVPDPTAPLRAASSTTVNNINLATGIPTPVSWEARLRVGDLMGQLLVQAPFASGNLLLPGGTRDVEISGPVNAVMGLVPLDATPKLLEQRFELNSGELNPQTRWNDTLRRRSALVNYYAYDDDTPESFFSLGGDATNLRYAALPYTVATPDYVEGIMLYIGPNFPVNQALVALVWGEDASQPGRPRPNTVAAQQVSFRVPADTVLTPLGRWFSVFFPQPMPVSGAFWAGYGQPVTTGANAVLNVGFDLNTDTQTDSLYYQVGAGNPWRAFRVPGALLVRPLMNQNPVLATAAGLSAAANPALWPNPVRASAEGRVLLGGTAAEAGDVALCDALGRVVRRAPAGAEALDVRGLAAGVYVVCFGQRAGRAPTKSQRLVVLD